MAIPAWRALARRFERRLAPLIAVLALTPGLLSAAEAPEAVPVEVVERSVAADSLLQGLQNLPVYPAEATVHRDPASVSYFTSAAIDEVWRHYEHHLREQGWALLDSGAYVGESGRQATFRKDQAQINVGVWIGNARDVRNATRVDIRHLGAVQVDALPRIDAIADSVHCFPQTCIYRSRQKHAGLLKRIIETLQPLGWEIVPLPPDTVRSEEAAKSFVTMRHQSSILDIYLGPPPAEEPPEGGASSPVQYSVRMAGD